ncbi:tetraspanin-8-like isoform X2 [Narcine bancroftii]|uniref:tetraspanin-8-like isoform X2 n=1 Tax=Narcine bancroftii TaxID=1343680 RepID=UPI0038312A33
MNEIKIEDYELCGSVILGVAIWVRVSKDAVKQVGDVNIEEFYIAVNILIAVGAIIMVLGFLGCCGAIKESRCMLLLFFIGLLLILAIQITAGVLGAVYKSQVESTLMEKYKQFLPLENQPKEFKEELEALQRELKCCGLVYGHQDWADPPASCNCNQNNSSACVSVKNRQIWAKPCITVLTNIFKDNLVIIVGIAFGLAVVEIFGLVFSMILYCQIKNK